MGSLAQIRQRALIAIECLSQEDRLCKRRVVGSPAVVHQNARVVEVAGVHCRSRKVVPNGFEHLLVPLVRDSVILSEACDGGKPSETAHHQRAQCMEKKSVHVIQNRRIEQEQVLLAAPNCKANPNLRPFCGYIL